jgi:H/ACA ribonucleoprotein complex subunit 3
MICCIIVAIIISTTMYLRYYLDESGKRVYTMKVVLEDGSYTLNAHPARFSPDDRFSKERIQCK